MLKRFFSAKKTPVSPDDFHELDYENLPVMTGEELITYLNLQNQVGMLRRKVNIHNKHFEVMYRKPLLRYCEIVQLMPASQNHHHAFAGGLITHTLETSILAVFERLKHSLPKNGDPEVIEAERNIWTFACFVAVMLHDIGKVITMCQFVCEQEIHNSYGKTLAELGQKKNTKSNSFQTENEVIVCINKSHFHFFKCSLKIESSA